MRALREDEIQAALDRLNAQARTPWQVKNGRLYKAFVFRNFVEAFGFMAQAALVAERMDHHPDWCNVYRRVEVTLFTHEVNGLTEKDFALAQAMEALAAAFDAA